MDLKLLKIDDKVINAMDNTTLKNYYLDANSYSIVGFRPLNNPPNSWAFPVVTGHKYKIHWQYGLDFT
jgi:hypothetical protein